MSESMEPAIACFAGGCFWCMQPPYDELPGVRETVVGYTGGEPANPTYEQVCSGTTGHVEAIQVHFDPAVTSYRELLEVFWRSIDPTDAGGQFADRGSQYRPVIFYADEDQRWLANKTLSDLAATPLFDKPIVVAVEPAGPFYPAEPEHQGYYRSCAAHYQQYKEGSGRGPFLRRVWGEH